MNRKRFIKICALGGISAEILAKNALIQPSKALKPIYWEGYLLGSKGQLSLFSNQPRKAQKTLKAVFKEVQRLEAKFSLYLNDSEINRLNREKVLLNPCEDWLKLCALSSEAHTRTQGYFDPTIQSIWSLQNRQTRAHSATDEQAENLKLEASIGWEKVSFSKSAIRIDNPKAEVSFNGIAQGYITDRITDLLKNEGFENALVELGETRALGNHPENRPFRIGIQKPDSPIIYRTAELHNNAIATSSTHGSYLNQAKGQGHIIDPRSGRSYEVNKTLSVLHSSAAVADALSTGLIFFKKEALKRFEIKYNDLKIINA